VTGGRAPIDERRFTDRDVREILKRAVQNGPADALASSRAFSLAELKAIGKEVGIDPARLEDAARAVTQRDERHGPPRRGLRGERIVGVEHEGGCCRAIRKRLVKRRNHKPSRARPTCVRRRWVPSSIPSPRRSSEWCMNWLN
jgi:hypothetical protein